MAKRRLAKQGGKKQELIMRLVDDLNPAEYNPRKMTEDDERSIIESVEKFGFVDPLIVNMHEDRRNVLVGGHQRLKVAKKLGHEEVPTVEVCLPEAEERELNIRLNKNQGRWDWSMLEENFETDELTDWGFSEDEVADFGVEDGKTDLREVDTDKPPTMAWVLIGVPIGRWGDIAEMAEAAAEIPDSIVETTANG